jgi:hypothetical protein
VTAGRARLLASLLVGFSIVSGSALHCGARLVNAVDLGAVPDDGALGAEASVTDAETADAGPDIGWPNPSSSTNSDPWLVAHHDSITEMHPSLLVLDYYNPMTVDEAKQKVQQQIDAIAQGSQYHGYADPTAPAFLNYQLYGLIDLTDHPPSPNWPYYSSTRVPVDANGAFDTAALFAMSFPDPGNPSSTPTLCELFDAGLINELWVMVGDRGSPAAVARKPGLFMESKQVYDSQLRAIPGMFDNCAGYVCLPSLAPLCKVTVRIAHLDPAIVGPGCDLVPRTMGIENTVDQGPIPYLSANGRAFFNEDFNTRYGTPFKSWGDLLGMGCSTSWCTTSSTACISYPSDTAVQGTYPPSCDGGPSGGSWRIPSFIQGCGTAHFAPNARFQWDIANTQPMRSRCEHYGLLDDPDGGDRLDEYTSDKVTALAPPSGNDCAGGWQLYLRQSIPGLHNAARAVDGSPMKNWWPFLFY